VAPADWERRHPGSVESWTFDFWTPLADGGGEPGLAGFVGLTYRPRPGRAWCWAALVGAGRPYLLVRDLDLDPPRRPGSRQLRGSLWADANCETPHEHWSVGLEAYGVALDDPADALRGERGHRTGLGIDLEWEATGPPAGGAGDYAAPAEVHGEVLVGAGRDVETIALTGVGIWRHCWGEGDGWLVDQRRQWLRGPDGLVPAGGCPEATAVLRAPFRLDDHPGAVVDRRFVVAGGPGAPVAGWLEGNPDT